MIWAILCAFGDWEKQNGLGNQSLSEDESSVRRIT